MGLKRRVVTRVMLESPHDGISPEEVARNMAYTDACLRDCLLRGEAPFASSVLYTRNDVLDEESLEERRLAVYARLAWRSVAQTVVLYVDYGISNDTKDCVEWAKREGRTVESRHLFKTDLEKRSWEASLSGGSPNIP